MYEILNNYSTVQKLWATTHFFICCFQGARLYRVSLNNSLGFWECFSLDIGTFWLIFHLFILALLHFQMNYVFSLLSQLSLTYSSIKNSTWLKGWTSVDSKDNKQLIKEPALKCIFGHCVTSKPLHRPKNPLCFVKSILKNATTR